jgi:YegS/Rv2252/BmrU family lipid kinase
MRKIRILINPRSGISQSFRTLRMAVDEHLEKPETDLSYQFMQNKDDGIAKAKRAVDEKVDTVIVVGGDGTISSVGRVLVHTDTILGVIPTGSGNGFARHFGIDLRIDKAVEQLSKGRSKAIDVGVVNDVPFFVTCSMAWDGAIVRTFEKFPFRGIMPYIFAGVQEYFDYKRQNMHITFDDGAELDLEQPVILTLANMTQFGGGAVIAPHAEADDGQLEFVSALQRDFPLLLANLARLFDGSIEKIPNLYTRSTTGLEIRREEAGPIQVDGELLDMDADIRVHVLSHALQVLVPEASGASN